MFLIRFLVGSIIIALVPEIAKRSNARIAGIVLLVPVITILGLYFTGRNLGPQATGQLARGAIIGLIPLLLFLVSIVSGANRLSLIANLVMASLIWCIAACTVVLSSRY